MQRTNLRFRATSIVIISLLVTTSALSQTTELNDCTSGLLGEHGAPESRAFFTISRIESKADDYSRGLQQTFAVRMGIPFFVTVRISDDPNCKSGYIEILDSEASGEKSAGRFIVRRVELTDGLDPEFRSEALTLEYEPNPLGNEFRKSPFERLGEITFKSGFPLPDQFARATVELPFMPGQAELNVRATDWQNEFYASPYSPPGELTVFGPNQFEKKAGQGYSYSGTVNAGNYTAVYDVMGTRISREFAVEAGIKRNVTIDGSQFMGKVGWLIEHGDEGSLISHRTRLQEIMGWGDITSDNQGPFCRYSRAGRVVLESPCISDELPQGEYIVDISPALMPTTVRLQVAAGEDRDRPADVGVYSLKDSVESESGPRKLSVNLRSSDNRSASFEFQGEVKHPLPVGKYRVEIQDGARQGTLRRVVDIRPAAETVTMIGEITTDKQSCPEVMQGMSATEFWPAGCGTGRAPDRGDTSLTGHWVVEAPENPYLAELHVLINRHHAGVGWRDPMQPITAVTMEKNWGEGWFRESGISIWETEDGGIEASYGQYGFCNCVQMNFSANKTGDPNVLMGTWRYDEKSGVAIWHRQPPAVIRSIRYSNKSANPANRGTQDEVLHGQRPLRITRQDPVSCGSGMSRGNCDGVWITIEGGNFAGGHDIWIDPASHMELRDKGWLCSNGETRDYGAEWRRCGSTNIAGDGVVGLRFQAVLWNGFASGKYVLWVDGQPIPIEVAIEGHPDESWAPEPALVDLATYDANHKKVPSLVEGTPFVVEAAFDGDHPSNWIRVQVRPEIVRRPEGEVGDASASTPQWVTLTRTADEKIFRSALMNLQTGEE